MKHDDLERVADLLGFVFIPEVVQPATAVRVSEVLQDIARLQKHIRALAAQAVDAADSPAGDAGHG
jgi:hypothetical protein